MAKKKSTKKVRTAATTPEDSEAVDQLLEDVSRYFSLLSEPTRLRIIRTICESEQSVGAIVEASGANQANVSRHLSMLYNAGVLARRRDGNFIYYQVSDPTLTDICRAACNRFAMHLEHDIDNHQSAVELADGFQTGARRNANRSRRPSQRV